MSRRPALPRRRWGLFVLSVVAVLAVALAALAFAWQNAQGPGSPPPASPRAPAGVVVPPLAGMRAYGAVAALSARGLKYRTVYVTDAAPGVVKSTSPGEGAIVAPGSVVTLYVGATPPPPSHKKHKKPHG